VGKVGKVSKAGGAGDISDTGEVMVFDDSCPMCSAAARWVGKKTAIVPVPASAWKENLNGIGQRELAASVWVVGHGAPKSESLAVARILRRSHSSVLRLIGRVVALWGMRHVANVIYRWVARNRHRFLRKRG